MNEREHVSIDVLHERLTNLITIVTDIRKDVGEMKIERSEDHDANLRLTNRVDRMENLHSDHLAEDDLVHKKVIDHLERHLTTVAVQQGQAEALGWLDKAMLRYFIPISLFTMAVYAFVVKN